MAKHKIGDLIGDRYKIIRILKGGMGVVYICFDNERHKLIALKTFLGKYLSSESVINSFKREALAWVHLEKHPYIVNAKFVINIDHRPYIGLEYIAPDEYGRNNLTHYLKTPIPLKKILKWAIQFCIGMEYSASRGITPHRDIKPDNIMITSSGIVKITDFGIAKLWDQDDKIVDWTEQAETGKIGLTFLRNSQNKTIVGTIPWMAPEQFEGKADIRSDIYSFGIVLYQMVNSGKKPFEFNTAEDYYDAHKNKHPKKLDSVLWPIIKKCLKKNPDKRYQDFLELRIDLEILYKQFTGKLPPRPLKETKLKARGYNDKGVSFATLNFLDDAIEEFKKAIIIRPNYARAHLNLGIIYRKKRLLDDAIKEFKEAIKIKPNLFEAKYNLAIAFHEKGLVREAINEYNKLIELEPYNIDIHYKLAKAYETIGNLEDAIMYYQNFIEFAPPKLSHYQKKTKKARQKVKTIKRKLQQLNKAKKNS
ncbi:MAG: protein kinase domain-containing protein [Promethearchaeota archaeon]